MSQIIDALNKAIPEYKRALCLDQDTNENGAFPWGKKSKVQHKESIDMTAHFIEYMYNEFDIEDRVKMADSFIKEKFADGGMKIFKNEWTKEVNPKTVSLVASAISKVNTKEDDMYKELFSYVKDNVGNIISKKFEERKMQNNFMSALGAYKLLIEGSDIEGKSDGYESTHNEDIAKLANFILKYEDTKGKIYYPLKVGMRDIEYKAYVRTEGYRNELSMYAADTFASISGKGAGLARGMLSSIEKEGKFVTGVPQTSLTYANAGLACSYYQEFEGLPEKIKDNIFGLTTDIPESIQNRMHTAGGLVKLRNILMEKD